MEAGGGTWGIRCYVYMRIVIGRLWYLIMCVEHLYKLYTYLICMYWAIIYKDKGTALFCSRTMIENSTCFGQFLYPSSGVFHCAHSNGICHTGLLRASCQQNGMTYTIAVCTVKNS